MPATASEERGRQTLTRLIQRFALQRGNWEVDCPEMVEKVLAMASGREPLCGRFAAVAADQSYAFIEVAVTEAVALDQLTRWAVDEHYPKCPLALADLHEGSIHQVRVTVCRGVALEPTPEEESPC
jgi:hypothetical protein